MVKEVEKMPAKDFNFEIYDQEKIAHIQRHLNGSYVTGSHFLNGSFSDSRELLEFAYGKIKDVYEGKRLVVEIDLDHDIGYDNLIKIDEIFQSSKITKEPRGKNEYMVNVVAGIPKKKTNHMVIVAGPKEKGKHGFYTIFPGKNAPSFPVPREKLIEWGYEGEDLEKQVQINAEYKKFWNEHAFIKD